MAETDLWFGTLSATVRVEDLPASRQVVAIELPANGEWRVCGAGTSNADGIAMLPITGLPTSRIYAVAIDDWGRPFVPGMTVAYGDVIRPTQFLGWMYQVTAPGALPTTEPEWWNSMAGIPQPVGTAMMQAIRHYQPIAHGPVSDIEWVEQEFDPHWDKVVALFPFDSGLEDLKGNFSFSIESGGTLAEVNAGQQLFGRNTLELVNSRLIGPSTNPFSRDEAFTVEAFILLPDSETPRMALLSKSLGRSYGDINFSLSSVGAEVVIASGGASFWTNRVWEAPSGLVNRFVHAAYCFDGTKMRCFVDGNELLIPRGTPIDNGRGWYDGGTTPLRIGGEQNAQYSNTRSSGRLANLRLTKGVARYTENFTPPTAPFPNVGPPL